MSSEKVPMPNGWLDYVMEHTNEFAFDTYLVPRGGFGPDRVGVRVTHTLTGRYASCDTERSQHRNKDIATKELCDILSKSTQLPALTIPTKASVLKVFEQATTSWLNRAIIALDKHLSTKEFVVGNLNDQTKTWIIAVEGTPSPGDVAKLLELLLTAGWVGSEIHKLINQTDIIIYKDKA